MYSSHIIPSIHHDHIFLAEAQGKEFGKHFLDTCGVELQVMTYDACLFDFVRELELK